MYIPQSTIALSRTQSCTPKGKGLSEKPGHEYTMSFHGYGRCGYCSSNITATRSALTVEPMHLKDFDKGTSIHEGSIQRDMFGKWLHALVVMYANVVKLQRQKSYSTCSYKRFTTNMLWIVLNSCSIRTPFPRAKHFVNMSIKMISIQV